MANPFLVERMEQAPNRCMMCGNGHIPRADGTIGPYANLGIDYNWGDSGYICEDCAGKLAMLFDWISPDTAQDMKREIKKLKKEIHDLNGEIDMRRSRERAALRKSRAVA